MNGDGELVPWHVFFEAVHNRPRPTLEKWLTRWRFGDAGVVLRRDLITDHDGNLKLEKSGLDLVKAQEAGRLGLLH